MGWEPASFLSRINPLIESGVLIRTGQKRGTRYSVAKADTSPPSEKVWRDASERLPLTQKEYHVVWRDVSERLRSFGMSHLVISRLVREVTGHETAISAQKNGVLTQQSVDQIFALGQEWVSTNQGSTSNGF